MPDPRFLVVRLSSLGDIVHTFPAVAALRQSFPQAEIAWLTHPRWKLLVESSGLASNIILGETKSFNGLLETFSRIRVGHYDTSIDYQGLWKSSTSPFFGGVKQRIGFSSASIREFGVPILYTKPVNTRALHIVEQNGELSVAAGAKSRVASASLNVAEPFLASLAIKLKSFDLEKYIVLSPGGGWRSKCWPPEHYGSLCAKIYEAHGIRCVINHGPGEESLAGIVQEASGRARPVLYNESLGSLMALLQNALLVVGGDTGPLHLAAAMGTSVIAIFGPTDPARNGPYSVDAARSGSRIVLRSPRAVTSYKRGDSPDPSLLDITVDDVFEAVQKIVGALA